MELIWILVSTTVVFAMGVCAGVLISNRDRAPREGAVREINIFLDELTEEQVENIKKVFEGRIKEGGLPWS